MSKSWKAYERRVARYFGSERTPLSGGNSRHTRSDSLHERLYIECKSNMQIKILSDWGDLRRRAKATESIPVVFYPHTIYQGVWSIAPAVLFHSDSLPIYTSDNPTVLDILQCNHCILQHKHDAIMRLYDDTLVKAAEEGKIPLLAIGQKNRPCFWIFCALRDLNTILLEL